ncbi:class I SAM-dependent methyltransferase [Okeania sp.]|uniref:SAM-dependent methyltransferase n=1 Tax=Okeania sp. TaxID=3100323 RepID=UPI002B4B2261|nr:class I SAM-dependent methyltransferase [Okeania sp.]MEB3343114.1 class I SAM-dependent methyltransferase [Okeania sp.]
MEIAKERTVKSMASLVEINSKYRVLDIGSGYGGTARFLAKKYGCHVTCLNISKKQNLVNQERNEQQKLSSLIDVYEGSFEDLPFPNSSFDIVWSQDAINFSH